MSKFELTVGIKKVTIEDEHIENIQTWTEIVDYFHKGLIAMGFILSRQQLVDDLGEEIEQYNDAIDLDRPRHNRDLI